MMEFTNPVSMFKRSNPKNEFLVDQAGSDVYLRRGVGLRLPIRHGEAAVLLWRTRMTVAAQGVSQEQSLPTLVLSAAPFFGKDMAEPEILSKRAIREGAVEIGTPTVVEPRPRARRTIQGKKK